MYNKPANLVIRNAKTLFGTNFSGRPTRFNPNGGSREINVIIEDFATAEALISQGWPLKVYHKQKDIRDLMKTSCNTLEERIAFIKDRGEYSEEFITFYIKCIISYKYENKKPNIYKVMPIANKIQEMTELNIDQFDGANVISKIDVEIQLSWHSNPTPGYSAYLKEAMVTVNESPFLNDYANYQRIQNEDEEE